MCVCVVVPQRASNVLDAKTRDTTPEEPGPRAYLRRACTSTTSYVPRLGLRREEAALWCGTHAHGGPAGRDSVSGRRPAHQEEEETSYLIALGQCHTRLRAHAHNTPTPGHGMPVPFCMCGQMYGSMRRYIHTRAFSLTPTHPSARWHIGSFTSPFPP